MVLVDRKSDGRSHHQRQLCFAMCGPRQLFAPGKVPSVPVGVYNSDGGVPCRDGPKGCSGRAESPPACIGMRQICRKKFPAKGNDAPTTAREQGLQPYGAFTLFFRWRKKSVQKKASGTATPEAARPASRRGLRPAGALRAVLGLGSLRSPAGKRLLLPILTAGLVMSRAA